MLSILDREAARERQRLAAEQEAERETRPSGRALDPPPPQPTGPPPRPRWWHPPKQWPSPTDAEIAAAVDALMADPVDGPARVSGDWTERFGIDGLGPLVAAWKARRG